MLGLFKKILSRTETPATPPPPAKAVKPPLPRPGAPAPSAKPGPIRVPVNTASRPAPAPAPVAPRPAAPVITPPPGSSTHVQVALTSIAASLPEAISHKVPAHPEQFVSVPVTTVLPQLGQGHVVMTAAELRECAPDYFSALAGHDEVAITLPLGEIVQQLSPNHFARRSQRRIEVPSNVLPVFAPDGQGFSVASQPAPAPTPVFRSQPTVTSTTPMPAAAPAAPAPAPAAPASKITMSPQAMAALGGATAPAAPVAPKPVVPAPAAPARPVGYAPQPAPAQPKPAPLPRTEPAPVPAAKKPSAAPSMPKLSGELAIPLASVCGGWVEEVRGQLQEVELSEHQILAPLELVEPAMKSGKVIFSWAEVASWIQPALPIPPTAKVGEMPVELPLKVIAPLFMAHARTGAQKRAAVDETIPDLFGDANGKTNGSLQSQVPATAPVSDVLPAARAVKPAAAAPAAPATNGFAAAPRAVAPAAAPQVKPAAPAPQEIAIESVVGPAEKRFSLKEIIGNSSRLPGVSGALLAMTDGLMVASQPASVKGETIAAFLPQMFGRMNQYTKELALGPLEQLTLTVESGQWHIIKAPNIYFAVLGKRGETLPTNLLAQVAAELSSQSK